MISILCSINNASSEWIFFMLNFSIYNGKLKDINPIYLKWFRFDT